MVIIEKTHGFFIIHAFSYDKQNKRAGAHLPARKRKYPAIRAVIGIFGVTLKSHRLAPNV